MFRAATSLAASRPVTPPFLCATRATVNSNQIPLRRFTGAKGCTRGKRLAPRTFLPPNRPTEANNPSAADLCPACGSSETHNQLGGASSCGTSMPSDSKALPSHNLGRAHSVYVTHNPYGSARQLPRPCDLRRPRSIRRAPRPVAHATRIQPAGASVSGTIRRATSYPTRPVILPPTKASQPMSLTAGKPYVQLGLFRKPSRPRCTRFSPATPLRRSRIPAPGDVTRRDQEVINEQRGESK